MFGLLTDEDIDMAKLQSSVMAHEGTGPVKNGQFMPYNDSLGNLTLGYGHLIANGVSSAAALQIMSDDLTNALDESKTQPWWANVVTCEPRARAMVELMFILGPVKFSEFHNMIAGLLANDFNIAANEIINSTLDHEDGERINLLSEMVRTGQDKILD